MIVTEFLWIPMRGTDLLALAQLRSTQVHRLIAQVHAIIAQVQVHALIAQVHVLIAQLELAEIFYNASAAANSANTR